MPALLATPAPRSLPLLLQVVMGGKGRISSIIQTSTETEKRLQQMIVDLETRLERTTKKTDTALYLQSTTGLPRRPVGPPLPPAVP